MIVCCCPCIQVFKQHIDGSVQACGNHSLRFSNKVTTFTTAYASGTHTYAYPILFQQYQCPSGLYARQREFSILFISLFPPTDAVNAWSERTLALVVGVPCTSDYICPRDAAGQINNTPMPRAYLRILCNATPKTPNYILDWVTRPFYRFVQHYRISFIIAYHFHIWQLSHSFVAMTLGKY